MKYVYLFEENKATPETVRLLGNKGAHLAEMNSIKLPVPPGFTITTEACREYFRLGKKWPEGLKEEIRENLAKLEKKLGKHFGDKNDPLFVSVRSGSYLSMPGMMDTILNLGMNDETVVGMAIQTKNQRAAYDAYRRFINMFGDVVLAIEHKLFEEKLQKLKSTRGVEFDTELDASDLKQLVNDYKEILREKTGRQFPSDVMEQLFLSVNAVFESWNNKRAIAYRRIHNITEDAGTAVNIQVMVFGNMGDDSGTGVGFTRNPATGENKPYGEYLLNAQGEDIVAGIRTPKPIEEMKKELPKPYKELMNVYKILDTHYKEMQDFEFTIEKSKLFLLQTRRGKRTAQAAVKIAVDMVDEGLIDKKTALLRIDPEQINQLLHKQIDPLAKEKNEAIAKGLPASPGAAVGEIVFTAEDAIELAKEGNKVILVRNETSAEDIEGMNSAQGILTARGGMTSHAAVVARGMGKCCIAGCVDLIITKDSLRIKDLEFRKRDYLTLDGSTGEVFKGKLPVVDPTFSREFKTLIEWADSFRKLGIRTNADTPKDSEVARNFGAEGIGLCRTEHMFFEGDRIKSMRQMILSNTIEERKKALEKLLPMQKSDFIAIFNVMDNLPVTIRLLDPPLHEFLPREQKEIKELAMEIGVSIDAINDAIRNLHEFNPMLGFRGCRLAIIYPEIAEMQVRAIIEAAIEVNKKGKTALPEIEIPVVGEVQEIIILKDLTKKVADELIKKSGVNVNYKIGTMIELPRACITADEIAKECDFFSFGTNDLTQTTYGYSRDDSARFIPAYINKNILKDDPFKTIDKDGVGFLMKICVEKARKVKDIEIGICGEHGGDPESIEFCHQIKLNYVSCSPYRVPIARLAAAQAAIKQLP